ncbi:hypothetical protein GQ54DRAFT_296470 [Martensiomyces pterosporus]|nr:hypothetical protein GQ54DRAFT_296470 [Martensiomyces pterosporus]
MASYYSELGIKEKDDGSQDEGSGSAFRGRWVSQVVDDFMNISSNRQTPVAALASPESYLNVARMFGEFRDNDERGSEHQQFLETLIVQLVEEANTSATGPPPASREFIRSLPVISPGACEKGASCTICNDDLEAKEDSTDVVTKLPCRHFFHRECVKPWLELHNTCPMCRFEVPSDDPAWAERKREEDRRAASELKDSMMYG